MLYLQFPVCSHGVLSILRLINEHKILIGKTHLGDLGLYGSLILIVRTGCWVHNMVEWHVLEICALLGIYTA